MYVSSHQDDIAPTLVNSLTKRVGQRDGKGTVIREKDKSRQRDEIR